MFSLVNFCPLRLLSWTLSSQSGVHRERMLKALTLGFPVGSVVKNLSADAGSIQPMLGSNEAHTPQLLSLFVLWSLGVTTTEPTNPNYWSPCPLGPILLNKRSHYNDKPVHATREQPPLAMTREGPCSKRNPAWPERQKGSSDVTMNWDWRNLPLIPGQMLGASNEKRHANSTVCFQNHHDLFIMDLLKPHYTQGTMLYPMKHTKLARKRLHLANPCSLLKFHY